MLGRLDHGQPHRKRESQYQVNGCKILRSRLRWRQLATRPVESKPKSTMIKRNRIGIMLIGSAPYRIKVANARVARGTRSNGPEMADQNEKSEPDSWAMGFVLMVLSKASEDRHFTDT